MRESKGILLFGPPGTGKTMLAKAVATEAGAYFINISTSSITSKWFSEGGNYVKAVFSLASKIAPSVIFVDEVCSYIDLGGYFRDKERVLVLAATNRPFDLDEAVIQRRPRRLTDEPVSDCCTLSHTRESGEGKEGESFGSG
ncbi:hypothetical protein F3Y22_tig00112614pilonHSYRG00116 [Hibiscus syriacus]|uniref:AAA+ ATPase domain-containing protein n=1 Tax=Hibiscus syriacus TaxID=106335 RepID=A0A6A2XE25_HIBSY|nr:hypothetical protein F3Y22_tig00112614pilonHSYRG00116 [Hibiscus syriacus]